MATLFDKAAKLEKEEILDEKGEFKLIALEERELMIDFKLVEKLKRIDLRLERIDAEIAAGKGNRVKLAKEGEKLATESMGILLNLGQHIHRTRRYFNALYGKAERIAEEHSKSVKLT